MITVERLKVEAKIIKRMLWRIRLKVTLDVLTFPELMSKSYIPILDKPPEEQEWDIAFFCPKDFAGHTAASLLVWHTEQGNWRWNEYDRIYEEMWEDMASTVDPKAQEKKIRQMVQHLYDRADYLFIYTPLSLYAVKKEVNFVPFKDAHLHFMETSVTDKQWSVRGGKK